MRHAGFEWRGVRDPSHEVCGPRRHLPDSRKFSAARKKCARTNPAMAAILRRMEDQRDPHYTPFGKPRAPKPPDVGEPLWTFRKDGWNGSCELLFRGESYGWEARVLNQGGLCISRRFIVRTAAVRWADEQRTDIERGCVDG